MDRYASARAYLQAHRPDKPVFGLRPHAAGVAARWFLKHFPGEVAYAYKANSAVFLIGALYGAGIRAFDVASIPELEDASTIPEATLHYMHPIKSRQAIKRAYFEYGVRCFALDSEDELEKILTETGSPDDLELFVRLTVPARNSSIPLERKFGIEGEAATALLMRTRQHCDTLGVCFHVGSHTVTTDAYELAFNTVRHHIVEAGVVVDAIDVGGGFPSQYGPNAPTPLIDFMRAISHGFDNLPVSHDCRLICEPGRALIAEAESLIVRVDARRGQELFINDGGYGALFDAAQLDFMLPVRLANREPDAGEEMQSFEMWGPTCDSIDHMKGPYQLPASIREGDYIEIGNMGAYGRAIAGGFNGYGRYLDVILDDEPMYTMFGEAQ
ncbi:MAG: ornithine decarboxylase [Hyphomicrobiaceae bacterium]|jgi:ornithine decarboxylase